MFTCQLIQVQLNIGKKCAVLEDLTAAIRDCGATHVIVGGDFNFNFATNVKSHTLFYLLTNNLLINCDILEVSRCSPGPQVTE